MKHTKYDMMNSDWYQNTMYIYTLCNVSILTKSNKSPRLIVDDEEWTQYCLAVSS